MEFHRSRHTEPHRSGRSPWLRALVLGANDGLISTSALLVGMISAGASHEAVVIAGVAGLLSGAISMGAGEYVSVSSQADAERADLEFERRELEKHPEAERAELAAIYRRRGLTPELAAQVADQLTAHDALAAHARDEIGISSTMRARPVQAALTSTVSFSIGASAPVLIAAFLPVADPVPVLSASTLGLLAVLGGVAAKLGGAPWLRGSVRVVFWGSVAMILTGFIGGLFDLPAVP